MENWERKKAIIAAAILIMSGGIFWEVLEFLSDLILKTKTFGLYGEYITKDTLMDISFNTIGIIAGVILLLRQNHNSPTLNNKPTNL